MSFLERQRREIRQTKAELEEASDRSIPPAEEDAADQGTTPNRWLHLVPTRRGAIVLVLAASD